MDKHLLLQSAPASFEVRFSILDLPYGQKLCESPSRCPREGDDAFGEEQDLPTKIGKVVIRQETTNFLAFSSLCNFLFDYNAMGIGNRGQEGQPPP